jgi:hypothetical protein
VVNSSDMYLILLPVIVLISQTGAHSFSFLNQLLENENETISIPSPSFIENIETMKIYSGVAYCKSGIKTWSCGPICDQLKATESVTAIESATKQNSALAAYDKDLDAIVISFKGSSNLVNFLADLALKPVPCLIGNITDMTVHFGLQKSYLALRTDVRETLESFVARYPTASIILTGHSLGAALSSFLALEIAETYPQLVDRTSLYTFGGPRVGNALFADQIEQAYGNRVYRVTHDHDIVTQMPTLNMFENLWMHFSVEYNVDSNGNIRKCVGREDPTCSLREKFAEFTTIGQVLKSLASPLTKGDVAEHALAGYTSGELGECFESDDEETVVEPAPSEPASSSIVNAEVGLYVSYILAAFI